MDSSQRIASFKIFWPYYLAEHKQARCRHTHFIGTTGFLVILTYFICVNLWLLAALACSLFLGFYFFQQEGKSNAFWILLTMIALMSWSEPRIFYAILFAYFWAWVGHFLIEHNRPATFQYPLWSLAADFRMWWEMCRGKHWG